MHFFKLAPLRRLETSYANVIMEPYRINEQGDSSARQRADREIINEASAHFRNDIEFGNTTEIDSNWPLNRTGSASNLEISGLGKCQMLI